MLLSSVAESRNVQRSEKLKMTSATELARIGNFQIATLLQMPIVAVGNIHLFRRIVMATLFESSLQIVFIQSVKRIVYTA